MWILIFTVAYIRWKVSKGGFFFYLGGALLTPLERMELECKIVGEKGLL